MGNGNLNIFEKYYLVTHVCGRVTNEAKEEEKGGREKLAISSASQKGRTGRRGQAIEGKGLVSSSICDAVQRT